MSYFEEYDVPQDGLNLNLGCGRDIRPGWVNVDFAAYPGVDLIVDLNRESNSGGILPFGDYTVDWIYASNLLEHLPQWENLVVDCYRVLADGGCLEIVVPYGYRWNSSYHCRYFLPCTINDLAWRKNKSIPAAGLQAVRRFHVVDEHLHWRVFGKWHHVPIGRRYSIHWLLMKAERWHS